MRSATLCGQYFIYAQATQSHSGSRTNNFARIGVEGGPMHASGISDSSAILCAFWKRLPSKSQASSAHKIGVLICSPSLSRALLLGRTKGGCPALSLADSLFEIDVMEGGYPPSLMFELVVRLVYQALTWLERRNLCDRNNVVHPTEHADTSKASSWLSEQYTIFDLVVRVYYYYDPRTDDRVRCNLLPG